MSFYLLTNTIVLANDCITSLNNPTLQDIIVAIYTVAITAKQYNNDVKEIAAEKTKHLGGLRNLNIEFTL